MTYRYELKSLQTPWVERGYTEIAGPFVSPEECNAIAHQRSPVMGACELAIIEIETGRHVLSVDLPTHATQFDGFNKDRIPGNVGEFIEPQDISA